MEGGNNGADSRTVEPYPLPAGWGSLGGVRICANPASAFSSLFGSSLLPLFLSCPIPVPFVFLFPMIRPLSIFTLSVLSVGLAGAEPSFHDGFHTESGYAESAGGDGRLSAQSLPGQSAWSLPKTGASPAFLFREEAGLKYPAIAYPNGGGVQITAGDAEIHTVGRKLAKGILMKGNAAIYASFLMSVSAHKPQGGAYVLFTGIGGLGAGIQDGNLMVLARQDARPNETGQNPSEWIPLLFQEYKANTTYFFVIKISDGGDGWGGEDEMEVWINPKEVSSEQEGSTNALVQNADSPGNIAPPSGGITDALLRVENLQGITLKFDELRVGTSWESVTGPIQP